MYTEVTIYNNDRDIIRSKSISLQIYTEKNVLWLFPIFRHLILTNRMNVVWTVCLIFRFILYRLVVLFLSLCVAFFFLNLYSMVMFHKQHIFTWIALTRCLNLKCISPKKQCIIILLTEVLLRTSHFGIW